MANQIKHYRNLKKISQQTLADMMQVDRSSIVRMESGEIDLTLSRIEQIAELLGISPSQLIGGENVTMIPVAGKVDSLGRVILNETQSSNRMVICPRGVTPDEVRAVTFDKFSIDRLAGDGSVIVYGLSADLKPSGAPGNDNVAFIGQQPLGDGPFAKFLRRPCIVTTKDGRQLVRTLMPGTAPGRFDLVAAGIHEENIEVAECLPILAIYLA